MFHPKPMRNNAADARALVQSQVVVSGLLLLIAWGVLHAINPLIARLVKMMVLWAAFYPGYVEVEGFEHAQALLIFSAPGLAIIWYFMCLGKATRIYNNDIRKVYTYLQTQGIYRRDGEEQAMRSALVKHIGLFVFWGCYVPGVLTLIGVRHGLVLLLIDENHAFAGGTLLVFWLISFNISTWAKGWELPAILHRLNNPHADRTTRAEQSAAELYINKVERPW